MNSPKVGIQPSDGSSSKVTNSVSALPALPAISGRLGRLLHVIARKLSKLDKLIEEQSNLQTITLIIKLDRSGRPRTVLIRTEVKSELPS